MNQCCAYNRKQLTRFLLVSLRFELLLLPQNIILLDFNTINAVLDYSENLLEISISIWPPPWKYPSRPKLR